MLLSFYHWDWRVLTRVPASLLAFHISHHSTQAREPNQVSEPGKNLRSIYERLWSPNIFSPLFRLKEGQNIRNKLRARKPRKKRKLKIQTNEGQQLIIPPELYRSFQCCPPPDLHQQCLNLIRLRALEQALRILV